MTPVPSAARAVARANTSPGRDAILGIARAPAGDADIDRGRGQSLDVTILVLVRGGESHPWRRSVELVPRPGVLAAASPKGAAANQPTAPRHPARRATSIDGRSPGSRVSAFAAFPGNSQWLCGSSSPLTVAGAAADLGQSRTAFPVRSHSRDRRSRHLTARARPLSMRTRKARLRSGGAQAIVVASSVPAWCGTKRERGGGIDPDAAAAPATVSGEHPSVSHWRHDASGKAEGRL